MTACLEIACSLPAPQPLRTMAAHPPSTSAWEREFSLPFRTVPCNPLFLATGVPATPIPEALQGELAGCLSCAHSPCLGGPVRNPSTGSIRPPLGSGNRARPGATAGESVTCLSAVVPAPVQHSSELGRGVESTMAPSSGRSPSPRLEMGFVWSFKCPRGSVS